MCLGAKTNSPRKFAFVSCFELPKQTQNKLRFDLIFFKMTYQFVLRFSLKYIGATFKAQKGSKDIVKIVHGTSVVQTYLYKVCIKLGLNHWCHMDYSNDVLYYLSGPWTWSCIDFDGRARKLLDLFKNILICLPKMNFGFGTTWGGVINDRIKIFEWTIPSN